MSLLDDATLAAKLHGECLRTLCCFNGAHFQGAARRTTLAGHTSFRLRKRLERLDSILCHQAYHAGDHLSTASGGASFDMTALRTAAVPFCGSDVSDDIQLATRTITLTTAEPGHGTDHMHVAFEPAVEVLLDGPDDVEVDTYLVWNCPIHWQSQGSTCFLL